MPHTQFYHLCIDLSVLSRFSVIKIDLPNYGDFELLLTQIEQFIDLCSKDQLQMVIEKCKFDVCSELSKSYFNCYNIIG